MVRGAACLSSNIVRYGSLADIPSCPSHVRFTPNSGHGMAIRDLQSLSVALEPKMSALPPKADIRRINTTTGVGRLSL